MTNYNLEEFKNWLETKLQNNSNLWQESNIIKINQTTCLDFNTLNNVSGCWEKTLAGNTGSGADEQGLSLVREWKALVDKRERERERERARRWP